LPVSERRSAAGSGKKRSALAALDSAEKGAVLEELLRSQPALRTAAEQIAREQLADAEHEMVAKEVESELRSLSSDELSGRAGRQRWGYVEPTEVAWELLEETVGSYECEIERLLALGMIGSAVETAIGLIAGLYRCDGCEDSDLLLSWAPDFPLEQAGVVVNKLAGVRVEVPPELLADIAPEWEASLAKRRKLSA
jgi:hypothetical protein